MSAAIAPNPADPQAPLGMPARPWWIGYIRQLKLDIPLAVESGGTGKADALNLSDLGAYKATIRTIAAAITAQENTIYRLIGSGSKTVTLPSASVVKSGAEVEIFIESPTITSVTISPAESEALISQGGAVDYVFTGLGKSVRMIRVGQSQWNVIEPDVSLTAADIAETSALKIMTAGERTKLTGIAVGANNYTHPATHPQSMIEGLADALAGKATNWTYQLHSGGVITGEQWKIHSFSSSGTLNLPKASTLPDGTQIAAMLVSALATVTITRQAGDQFLTPTGVATSYTLQGNGSSLVLVKVTSNAWVALGTQEALINAKAEGALLTEGTPSGPTATGTKGMARFDADYFYVCTATNTWVRFAKAGSWT